MPSPVIFSGHRVMKDWIETKKNQPQKPYWRYQDEQKFFPLLPDPVTWYRKQV